MELHYPSRQQAVDVNLIVLHCLKTELQRVSGQPYEVFVDEHILQPLGMKNSSFHQPLPEPLTPLVSNGYDDSTEKPPVGFEIIDPAPAGAFSTTAPDMGRGTGAVEWR